MRPVGKLLWPFVAGAYPCAEIMFMLQRNIGFYVIQVFFTSYRVCYQDFLLQDAMSQDQDSSLSKTATLRHAHRCVGHVIQVFVPSILTVIMSWLSFWINIESVPAARSSHPGQVVHTHTHMPLSSSTESVPARINLGLLTVVTITYQSTGVNATLPRVLQTT